MRQGAWEALWEGLASACRKSARRAVGVLMVAAGAAQASEPDLLTFDRIAYELAVLDLVEVQAPVDQPPADLVFKGGFEWLPPFNPCAHLPPDEPSGICHCPPLPPWGVCL